MLPSDTKKMETKQKLNKAMLRALRQKPTQRYMIYKVFVEQLVSRQAAVKIVGSSGMALSLDQLIAESWNYMQRFASYLVENGLSKVRYEPGTVLFAAQDNELREFFDFADQANRRGEIRRLALNVCPISKEGNVFSFIHKSILEFLVAKQVRDDYADALDTLAETGLPVHITEVTVAAPDDPEHRAAQLEALMRLWWGHPAVDQVIFWSLWNKLGPRSHLQLGIYDDEGRPTRHGQAALSLINDRWRTRSVTTTGDDGAATMRVTMGEYVAQWMEDGRKAQKLP